MRANYLCHTGAYMHIIRYGWVLMQQLLQFFNFTDDCAIAHTICGIGKMRAIRFTTGLQGQS